MRILLRWKVLIPLAAVTALAIPLVLSQFVFAVPPPSHNFFGTVTVDGQNVADGTLIEAIIDGTIVAGTGASFTNAGVSVYGLLSVAGDDSDTAGVKEGGAPGDTVQFRVSGLLASETGSWTQGTVTELNLTAATGTGGEPTRVRLDSPAQVAAGSNFSVQLVVETGDQVAGLQSGLQYDSALIGFQSVTGDVATAACITSGGLTTGGLATIVQVCAQGVPGSRVRYRVVYR